MCSWRLVCATYVLNTLMFVAGFRTDVVVQLFEWTWPDIEKECREYLGPKGYAAVQISPPNEGVFNKGYWWERYQPVSYKLESRSGNEAQLVSMIRTCKEAGVKVIADMVINHMAQGRDVGNAGTHCAGNRTFELWPNQEDFHHWPNDSSGSCDIDWFYWKPNKPTFGDPPSDIVWYCDISGLPDLATEKPHVQVGIAKQIRKVLDLGAGGLRIDAAKHIHPGQLSEILARVKAMGPMPSDIFLETFSNESKPVKPSMYFDIGTVEDFQYAKTIAPPIMQSQLGDLAGIGKKLAYHSRNVVVFIDNHDTQRNGWAPVSCQQNQALYIMASAFMLAWPYGHPRVMSSFYMVGPTDQIRFDHGPPPVPVQDGSRLNCQDGKHWVCEHRIPAIGNLVAWRKVAGKSPVRYLFEEGGVHFAFGRGRAFLAMNRNTSTWHAKLQTGLPTGLYCDVSQSDEAVICPRIIVDEEGYAIVAVPGIGTTAFHSGAMISPALYF